MKYGFNIKEDPKRYMRLQSRDQRLRNPVYYLYNQAKYRAKQRGIEFSITRNDIPIPEFCPVFGIRLQINPGKRLGNSYSLDRKDNTKGYIPGNVRVISWKANMYKGDLTLQEVEQLLNYMRGE